MSAFDLVLEGHVSDHSLSCHMSNILQSLTLLQHCVEPMSGSLPTVGSQTGNILAQVYPETDNQAERLDYCQGQHLT